MNMEVCQVVDQVKITLTPKLNLQKWGHRYKECKNFKKSLYQEKLIPSPFQ